MTKREENRLRSLFEKRKKSIQKMNEVATIFNEEVYELYGFNYSDTDDTRIIETLNYGNDNLEFEEFLSLMEEYKKEFSPGVN